MILKEILNGYTAEESADVALFFMELNRNKIEKDLYPRIASTLSGLLSDNRSFLDKETIEKLDSLLAYVREE